MKTEAQRQMVNISVMDVKEVISKLEPEKFEKMIIDNNSQIIVSNYFYVKFSGTSANRVVKKLVFPLFPEIANVFAGFEGGEQSHGRKCKVDDEYLLHLISGYKIEATDMDIITSMTDVFDYPIEVGNGRVSAPQHKYFIPSMTGRHECPQCKGEKYITCTNPACLGKHEWACPMCRGSRKLKCETCNASGYVMCKTCKGRGEEKCAACSGTAQVKCSHCGGDGYVGKPLPDGSNKCTLCEGKGWHLCNECSNGHVKCDPCNGRGEVKCHDCHGTGQVDCGNCKATGSIVCEKCYSDDARLGKIDCPTCKTMGMMGELVFVDTVITDHAIERIICKNAKLNLISDQQVMDCSNKNGKTEILMVNINEEKIEAYDDLSSDFALAIENELGIEKLTFPKILKEELFYELIPCVHTAYRHMLTNTVHEFTILNFFNRPVIVFHSEPEQIQASVGNAMKATGKLFGKIFKTKSYEEKEDKKKEIRLMIYVAKVDGAIQDVEKQIIAENIGSLEDFTNAEKKDLFGIMSIKTLPELTKEDVSFSSNANIEQIVKDLVNIALADGNMNINEKEIIDRIKLLMNK